MWFRKVIHTADDHALTLLRLVLGMVFFAHGAQKALGWFGGAGFDQTLHTFTHVMNIPEVFAIMAIAAEFLGGIGLLVGLLARIAAFGIGVNMVVAVFLMHAQNGFFMNWTGKQHGEGFEFHLLVIAMAFYVMVRGAGAWSLDRALESWLVGGRTLHIHMEPEPSR